MHARRGMASAAAWRHPRSDRVAPIAMLLAPLLFAVAGQALADDAADWLARMRDALDGRDYQGTLVHLRDGQLDALDVRHRVGPDGVIEQLRSLSGEPRDLRREAGAARLTTAPAGADTVLAAVSRSIRAPLPPADHYRLALLGHGRIAGRATRLLEIRPRDSFRYGYRLWLDSATALPLKSIAFDPDGSAVEQWMFTAIAFDAAPMSSVPGAGGQTGSSRARDDAQTTPARWQIRDLPPGFRQVFAARLGARGEHQVFSDGLARVSLFVEPLDELAETQSGLRRRGALSMVGRVLAGHQLTVIGEVPPLTAERIARGAEAP